MSNVGGYKVKKWWMCQQSLPIHWQPCKSDLQNHTYNNHLIGLMSEFLELPHLKHWGRALRDDRSRFCLYTYFLFTILKIQIIESEPDLTAFSP